MPGRNEVHRVKRHKSSILRVANSNLVSHREETETMGTACAQESWELDTDACRRDRVSEENDLA